MSDGAIRVIGGWRMLASVPVFFKYCFLGLVAAALIIVAFAYLKSVICRAFAERSVQIGTFQDLSDAKINHAPYLVSRANELFQRVPLDALYEVKVPPLKTGFGPKEDLKFLDNVKINIQGVDIPDVIKSVFAILPDDQPVASAEPEPAGGGSAMRLDWKEPWGEKKSWLLRSDKPPNDPGATQDLIDQAIYKMVYYLYYDPQKHKSPPAGVDFPSERALVAYYSGQQYLGAYQRKLGSAEASTSQKKAGDQPDEPQKQYSDLDEAERQFRILYQEMPSFPDGLMLLGITLMEQKKETEAIGIFEQVKQILLRRAESQADQAQRPQVERLRGALSSGYLKPEDKKALLSAILFRATAERKLYRLGDNHSALAEIEDVLAVIGLTHPEPAPRHENDKQRADRQDFVKIHISVLAEKAYVLGAYLVLLTQLNFVEGLRPTVEGDKPQRVNPPNLVRLQPDEVTTLAAIDKRIKDGGPDLAQAKTERLARYRERMDAIYTFHGRTVERARELIGSVPSDVKWSGTRQRFASDLSNAAGYAQFRHAQDVMDVADDDDVFLTECRQALGKLNSAHAVHQNEQTILLNLGLVESYARCDPKNLNIEAPRRNLEQAAALKPTDYYAPQLLATLGIRELFAWGPLAKPETLQRSIDAAEKAHRLRPEDATVLALVAQAYILQWTQTDDDKVRKSAKDKIEAAIAQAEKRDATPVHLHTVRLQWLVSQAAKADGNAFGAFKTLLNMEIDKAITDARDDPSWYGHQLMKDAIALRGQLEKIEGKDRANLHWPN